VNQEWSETLYIHQNLTITPSCSTRKTEETKY